MNLILIAGFVVLIIYLLSKYFLTYWTRLNIPQFDGQFFFGNGKKLFTKQVSFLEFFEDVYKKTKNHRVFGIYMLYKPILIINDPKLVQDILIRDFSTFHDRPMVAESAEYCPLMANLFNMEGKKWRELRVRISPAFTAGKLRNMIPIQKTSTEVLLKFIRKNIKNGENVFDFKDTLARYILSTISSVGFGIDNDCINEPDNMFRKISLMVFELSMSNGIKNFLMFFLPDLFTFLKLNPFTPEVSPYIVSMVEQTIAHREKNNYQRNDFMDLLIRLRNVGYLPADKDDEVEDEWTRKQTDVDRMKKISMDEVIGQSFVFTIGGFETISSCMHFCLFELSRNSQAKQKLQQEIDQILDSQKSDEITYDALLDMKYLDCCISETLRKYPLGGLLNRVNSKDYKIPDSNVTIPKGTSIFIPFFGLQRDPQYYDEPMKFIPERFERSVNGNAKIDEGVVYAPFGDGPRHCIGMRMARIQMKFGLATLLRNFKFELQDKFMMNEEIKFNPKFMVLTPMKPILMNISERK
ncbi:unnamed protein product [Chironomus riparius]|uniref:Cytochrome P450 n=1 Tax=Chironomus riparius TaxID=315576 RepID=A0A9N9WZP2_9DIPT|nr:unnamed protein product [Chironomus riparius]